MIEWVRFGEEILEKPGLDPQERVVIQSHLTALQKEQVRLSDPEVPGKILTFTDKERKALTDDGAVIYLPKGETIRGQKSARRTFWYITDGYKEGGKNRLTEFPSRRIEVAIYPDPEKFFVPDTFNKDTDRQTVLIEQDADSLRKRLGLENITEILPEASEATEVIFRYFDKTAVRLLGRDYMRDGHWSYIRTATPTNKEGSFVAYVGCWSDGIGLHVYDWFRAMRVMSVLGPPVG